LITINNLRDMEGDRLVGKKTVAVRFGLKFSRGELAVLCFAPYLMNLYWMAHGYWIAGLLPWFTFPLAVRLVQNIWQTPPGRDYNQFLGQAARLHLAFGLVLAGGFTLS
jgi:1,4-dihydroxy-2-naphthoate polyprenyltransferase